MPGAIEDSFNLAKRANERLLSSTDTLQESYFTRIFKQPKTDVATYNEVNRECFLWLFP
jgi:hypothetical protein